MARIRQAEVASQRSHGAVTLVAVSKIQPIERIKTVLQAGVRVFGENYVQEARSKWLALREQYPDIKLHMVGPLQSNKVNQAFGLFDAIHSLDRMSLAKKLAHVAQACGRCPELFVQVNTGSEPQKAGVLSEDIDSFIKKGRSLDLPIKGLMSIPPQSESPAPHFKMLANMAHRNDLTGLSMGMSADFEMAITHGATHIRIGSALFGARQAART